MLEISELYNLNDILEAYDILHSFIRNDPLHILNYVGDGFRKVCDVRHSSHDTWWYYANIDETLMYSRHRSWVYCIVSDKSIVKIGETGQPLGIRQDYHCTQPIANTKNRFGRLRSMVDKSRSDTDQRIRETLYTDVQNLAVSLWAKKCEMITTSTVVMGQNIDIISCFHKDLEKIYLNRIQDTLGYLPLCNKGKI